MSEVSPGPLESQIAPSLFLDQGKFFQYLAECRAILGVQRFAQDDEAFTTGSAYMTELNQMACEAGFLGKPATLIGQDLSVSYQVHNQDMNNMENRTLALGQGETNEAISVAGTFSHFYYGYHEIIGGDTRQYRLELGCVLLVNETMNKFSSQSYAYGSLDNTTLEFVADKRRVDVFTSVATFLEESDSAKEKLVADLARFIDAEAVSMEYLRGAALAINNFLDTPDERVSESDRTALLNLVRAKLGLYGPKKYKLDVKSCLEPNNSTNVHTVVAGIVGSAVVNDIVYGPICKMDTTGKWMPDNNRPYALYATSEVAGDTTSSRSLLLPLNVVYELQSIN